VRFGADFLTRLEHFAERVAAARERRAGRGSAGAAGGGYEFVGYRPYRAGEDLRALDWNLLARLDRPFVRVTQEEAGERWLVLFDTSASMGVGPPGKLQRAAEVSAAIACLALRLAAEARVVDLGLLETAPGQAALSIKKRAALSELLAFLEARVARGRPGPRALGSELAGRARAERIFVVGDLCSSSPLDWLPLARRGRELHLVQILAPVELHPPADGAIEWWEPETGAALSLTVDEHLCARYAVELERRLAQWRAACAERRVSYACSSSALEFEDIVRRALRSRAG
jgi:uncharacterized protein (DUF58 family)